MNNLIQLLKDTQARISLGEKWLVWINDNFIVYSRKRYSRYNAIHYSGDSFDEALKILGG